MKSPLSTAKYVWVLLFVILCLTKHQVQAQVLVINEFMAANTRTIADPDFHSYSDWIEIYNPGSQSVNLKNWSITDNGTQPAKYRITIDTSIAPGQYLLIWADDQNTGLHTNFKLSASGEMIGLYTPQGSVCDTITFAAQQDDISLGRYPNGSGSFTFLKPASPGAVNLESGIFNRLAPPVFSKKSGFYPAAVQLSLSHENSNVVIRYTTDGKMPGNGSPQYLTPLQIESTTVVKARAFLNGSLPSNCVTSTYFINESTSLPVFSLSTDPDNLFSDTSGIYVIGTRGITGLCSTTPRNWNQEWERPIDIEFFEKDRNKGFSSTSGVKIYGGCSRIYAMKSLAFYFRDTYGYGKLDYSLFPQLNISEYNNFVLRSSGQDWWRTMFRDAMVQTLITQGCSLATQAYRPATVFINGSYWGIHNIREKLNEHYLAYHYQIDKDNVDIIEISKAVSANNGDTTAYSAMINYLASNDLSQAANYEYIKNIVDIDDYLDYVTVQIFSANGDWPGANSKLWRERKSNSKWRWMVYDLDFTFGGNSQGLYNTNTLATATEANGPEWPNPPWSTLMLRRLLLNAEFKYAFVQKLAAHINTTFRREQVHKVIDSIASIIAPEISRHKARWPQSISMSNNWNSNIQVMKDFATNRPAAIREFYKNKFQLSGTYTVTISRNISNAGTIYTANLAVKADSQAHVFFKEIPLMIKAVPASGYRFVQWEGLSQARNAEIILQSSADGKLKAIFEPVTGLSNDDIHAERFTLLQNFPNPFNPATTIGFVIQDNEPVTFTVYSQVGEVVYEQKIQNPSIGYHELHFDGSTLASGIYFYELKSGNTRDIKKCILLK